MDECIGPVRTQIPCRDLVFRALSRRAASHSALLVYEHALLTIGSSQTYDEIASALDLSQRTVARGMRLLRTLGLVRSLPSGGWWVVDRVGLRLGSVLKLAAEGRLDLDPVAGTVTDPKSGRAFDWSEVATTPEWCETPVAAYDTSGRCHMTPVAYHDTSVIQDMTPVAGHDTSVSLDENETSGFSSPELRTPKPTPTPSPDFPTTYAPATPELSAETALDSTLTDENDVQNAKKSGYIYSFTSRSLDRDLTSNVNNTLTGTPETTQNPTPNPARRPRPRKSPAKAPESLEPYDPPKIPLQRASGLPSAAFEHSRDPFREQVERALAVANEVFGTRYGVYTRAGRHNERYGVLHRALNVWGFTVEELTQAFQACKADRWWRERGITDPVNILRKETTIQRFLTDKPAQFDRAGLNLVAGGEWESEFV